MKKMYQHPETEITELQTECFLCSSAPGPSINIQEDEYADGNFEELNLRSKSIWED